MGICWNLRCRVDVPEGTRGRCKICGESLMLVDRYCALALLSDETIAETSGDTCQQWHALDCDRIGVPQACVVMKFSGGDRAAEQFQRTTRSLNSLGGRLGLPKTIDTGIVNRKDSDRDDGGNEADYLVRSWIEGETLAREMRSGQYAGDAVRSQLTDLLAIVQYIHSRRLIHGNLQPATLVRTDADRLIPLDFRYTQPRDRPSRVTPPTAIDYCAPEYLRGQLVPASDLYSVGAIAVQLLTSLSPLELYDAVDDRWNWRDFLPPDRPVSPQLGRVLDRLLVTQLDRRYSRAIDAIQDLDAIPEATAAPPPSSQSRYTEPIALTVPIPPAPTFWQRWLGMTEPAISPTELDCTELRDRLAARDWRSADRETACLLRRATNARSRYLDARDVEQLDADDLAFLDRLWREASDDRFGFSIQQRIYRECDGDYLRFCRRVGWPVSTRTTAAAAEPWDYRDTAPEGHLPSRRWVLAASPLRALQAVFASIDRHRFALPPRYVSPDSNATSS